MASKYSIVQFPTTRGKPADVNTVLASQRQLNNTAVPANDKKITGAALDSIVPIAYGRVSVPALLGNAVVYFNYWHFFCIWCLGEIEGFERITVNNISRPLPTGQALHLGTDPQALDPSLFMALTTWIRNITHQAISWDETLPGIAYTDVTVPLANVEQPPQISAIIFGRKVYDPRDVAQDVDDNTTWTYSRNPALILADFLHSQRYGPGYDIDWPSVEETADACDATGRTADFLIDKRTKVSEWVATLQQAANCWISPNGRTMKLKPDALTSSVATFEHEDGVILNVSGEEGENAGNQITVMEITYTDTSEVEWSDKSIPLIKLPGVDDFTIPYRKSTVPMPWIQNELIAIREGYLRFNKLRLRVPKFVIDVMDEGLQLEVGDRISLTYRDSGYTALLPVKISSISPTDQGYRLGVFYDDPGAYVDDRIADPTPPTDLPDPLIVPPVTNLTAVQIENTNQAYLSWTPPNYPFIKDYRVIIYDATDAVVDTGWPRRDYPFMRTVDLAEGDYLGCVTVRNTLGILSPEVCVAFHISGDFFVSDAGCFTVPTLVNMKEMYSFGSGSKYWVTSMGDLWNPTFPNPLDTYVNPIYTYHTPGTSTLTTEISDSGAQQVNAVFEGSVTSVAINGTVDEYLELSTVLPTFIRRYDGYIGDGRYVRFSSEALTTSTQRVNALGCYTVTRGQGGGPPVGAPAIPTGINATDAAGADVTITWNAPPGPALATSYTVYRSTTFGVQGSSIGTPSVPTFTDSTAVGGTTYYYSVTATGIGGTSAVSAQDAGSAALGVTWNPSDKGATAVLSNGDLTFAAINASGGWWARATVGKSTGKWYFEVRVDVSGAATQSPVVGVQLGGVNNINNKIGSVGGGGYSIQTASPFTWNNGSATGSVLDFAFAGDIVAIALDMTAGKIWFAVNNTWVSGNPSAGTGERYSGISGTYFPAISEGSNAPSGSYTAHFDLADMAFTPPTGFTAWSGF